MTEPKTNSIYPWVLLSGALMTLEVLGSPGVWGTPQPPVVSPSPTPEQFLLPEIDPAQIPSPLIVNRFEVVGNTALTAAEIAEITEPWLDRPLSLAELFQVRSLLTQAYHRRGYINAGALIPPQTFTQERVVRIQVWEGEVGEINVVGNQRLRTEYIRDRLAIAAQRPLNIHRLLTGLQLLQLNPLIANVSAELAPTSQRSVSLLKVKITEANPFQGWVMLNTPVSPTAGSTGVGIGLTAGNVTGWGDRLEIEYHRTEGSERLHTSYTIPVNPRQGTLTLTYRQDTQHQRASAINLLDKQTITRHSELSFRHPIIQTPTQEFALGLTLSHHQSESPHTPSHTQVTALRFFQTWQQQSTTALFSLWSQFTFARARHEGGIEAPENPFYTWRFQGQWAKELAENTLLLLRSDLQLSSHSLVFPEAFRLGGVERGRGYRQDFLLTDNGWFASAELRLPLPGFPQREKFLWQITPFFDYGMGWNHSSDHFHQIAALGIGLYGEIGDRLTVGWQWGIPLIQASYKPAPPTGQEARLYFFIHYQPL